MEEGRVVEHGTYEKQWKLWQEGRLKRLLGHGDIIKMNVKYIEFSWVDSVCSG